MPVLACQAVFADIDTLPPVNAITQVIAFTETDEPQEQPLLERAVSLSEVGYPTGIQFSRLQGEAELFFAVPADAGIEGLELRLDLSQGVSHTADRYIQILSDGQIIHVARLDAGQSSFQIRTTIPLTAVQSGFARLGIRYGGGMTGERCLDERVSGDYVTILPSSALWISLNPRTAAGLQALRPLLPRDTVFEVDPSSLSPEMFAAVLRGASLFDADQGWMRASAAQTIAQSLPNLWQQTRFQTGDVGGADDALLSYANGQPNIALMGAHPARALQEFAPNWQDVGANGNGGTMMPERANQLSFAQLSGGLEPRYIVYRDGVELNFGIEVFPAGLRPETLNLSLISAQGADQPDATVSVILNDTLLGSGLTQADRPLHLSLPIPENLIGARNTMRLEVQRSPLAGNCQLSPQGYLAQILPDSHFDLIPYDVEYRNFHDLVQSFQTHAVVIAHADDIATSAIDLDWILPVSASLIPPEAHIDLRKPLALETIAEPFLYISRTPPEHARLLVHEDRGHVSVETQQGDILFEGSDLDQAGLAQIIELNGQHGIWFRPGIGPAPRPTALQPLTLNRGNVAFLDAQGVALALSTHTPDLARISYGDITDRLAVLGTYRNWIITTIWLIVSFVLIRALRRARNTRQRSG